jgi:hypothetical protein
LQAQRSNLADNQAPAVGSVGLWRIFGAFLWLGCTSFGGGSAGWLYREMVLKRLWIDDQTFLAAMALGQVMPGANGVKLSVLIGQHLRGGLGAAVAVFGLLAGPFRSSSRSAPSMPGSASTRSCTRCSTGSPRRWSG